ncbi:MAG: hypothetical protein K0S04_412 [Herbinix sp.]|nr:hypothetical protein [Herbinix sp.]
MNKTMMERKKYNLLFIFTSICFISIIVFRCLDILGGITDKFFFLLCVFMLLLLNFMRTKEVPNFKEKENFESTPYPNTLLITILIGDVIYILSVFYEFKNKVI